MPFTTNAGIRLFWEERGQGSPLLLVMGHRYSSAMWYPALDALAAKHRVISFDNRGTGRTDSATGFSIADMADDALAVLDAAGVDRAHIYGVSMGGVIVQDMAIRHPERALSLIVGCSGMLTREKPRAPLIVRALYYVPPKILAWLFRNMPHGYGSAASADLIAHDKAVVERDPISMRGVRAQQRAIRKHSVSVEQVRALTMPALVLHGDEDRTVPHSYGVELADTLPRARFVSLPGAGHNYLIAHQDTANTAVLTFLDEVDIPGPATA
ncbi:alpha/beta hydrolase [Sphingomonas sp. CGMCC 1.13654]|uniref:Alpha/beta hydrolase n=1 Tax=Sphingomonas chungangi TaxID=2683589 RepID=A0A838L4H9_9SPHN|nr:alpha/beta hydrolase [Sphingomonas chungangi]MBA2934064.1 alpha/beta hydrolase [Sphingomonas chungangi]MVW57810.1 alpha/beta fold hydrolase [Sphingomonas chungangi]